MMEIHGYLDIDLDPDDILRKFGLEEHGPVQKAVDTAVIDYMMPYWAWDSGTLARDAYTRSDIGSGLITYAPAGKDGVSYAHYMYYGEVYGPNYPIEKDDAGNVLQWRSPFGQKKHPTGRAIKYKTDVNPLAGAFPFERMKKDHMDDILERARKIARDKQR